MESLKKLLKNMFGIFEKNPRKISRRISVGTVLKQCKQDFLHVFFYKNYGRKLCRVSEGSFD